jgi:hypothetical protein
LIGRSSANHHGPIATDRQASVEAASIGPASKEEEKMRKLVKTFIGSILLAQGMAAHAGVIPFTGTVTGVSTVIGADASCAPLQFRSKIFPESTTGYSSLGNFTYSTSTCLSLGGGSSFGTFTIDFGADSFSGTFDGGSTPTDIAGISSTEWLFTILSGTGRFAGASGTFEGGGLADARTRPTHVAIAFIGDVMTPSVPEPASWGLMLLGFAAVGVLLRRRPPRMLEQIA